MTMMKNMPLISIIVSVYNGGKYLQECLESVLNQDYTNIELIAVDDGSTDCSGKILDEFAMYDSRITVIHQKNSGVSASRNKALDIAKGLYVTLLDQDDVLARNYISYLYGLIQANNADIALTWQPQKFYKSVPNLKSSNVTRNLNGVDVAKMMLYHKIVIAPWNKLICRELIERYHIRFDKRFFNGEGFAFSIECFLKASKVILSNNKVYYYRVGDPHSGASVFKEKYIHSSINAQQYIKQIIVKNNVWESLSTAWQFSNWHTHCDAFNIMVGCGVKKQYIDLYKRIRSVCKQYAYCAFTAPISLQQKLRGFLFMFSPYIAAKIINRFRIRKFTKI